MRGGPCQRCRHFNYEVTDNNTCPAYPDGIPSRILIGGTHDVVQPDQEGDTVFEPEE